MSWYSGFADPIECDVPLGPLTWFRLGGRARYIFRPRDAGELARLVARARHEGISVRVLGAGANVLISDDGFDGVVVRLDQPAFAKVERRGTAVDVGAGVSLMPLSQECSAKGLSGLEGLAGIPATMGGAVRMNAGGRFAEIGRVVSSVDLLRPDGIPETWGHDRIGFRYRQTGLSDEIVLSVRLELIDDDPTSVKRHFDDCLEYKRRSQPLTERTAGCIFKNPPGESAGSLIDRAGLKDRRVGGARVSTRHANFIVADREASASDVLKLIDIVRERVLELYDTQLELEIEIWRPGRARCGT